MARSLSRLAIYRLRNKCDNTGSVNNAPKSGRPEISVTEETETKMIITVANSPKKSHTTCFGKTILAKNIIATLIMLAENKIVLTRLAHGLLEDDLDHRLQFWKNNA